VNREDWCYVSGLIAGLGTKLVEADFFNRLPDCGTERELLAMLEETDLKSVFRDPDDLHRAGERAEKYFSANVLDIRPYCPAPEVADFWMLDFDLLNFKSIVKSDVLGIEEPFSEAGSTPRTILEQAWKGEEPTDTEWDTLAADVRAAIADAENKAFVIDWVVDCAHLRMALECARATEGDIIIRATEEYCRLKRILVLYRARISNAPAEDVRTLFLGEADEATAGLLETPDDELQEAVASLLPREIAEAFNAAGPEEAPLALSRAIDDHMMKELKDCKAIAYGPEPVMAYLCGLAAECSNLKLTIGGLVSNVSPDRIRQRLRSTYV